MLYSKKNLLGCTFCQWGLEYADYPCREGKTPPPPKEVGLV